MSEETGCSGIFAPVLTPFRQDLSIDHDKLMELCRSLVSQNAGLALFGTTSEANSSSVEERMEALDALISAGLDPAAMMVGTGCCAISDTVKLTRHAVQHSCGAVLMLPPFYYKAVTTDGLFRSFSEVIDRVGDERLRIYLYHIPPVAQVPIEPQLIEMLLKAYPGTIAGIKDSSGDWNNTATLLRAFQNLRVFAGSEKFLLKTLRHGGAGCISATANINADAIHRTYAGWQTSDADALQESITAFRLILEAYPMIPALKTVLAHRLQEPGWRCVRPPLLELSDEQMRALLQQIDAAFVTNRELAS